MKDLKEKVEQLKEAAINNQQGCQFPNEHYIEATGMILALNEVLSVLSSQIEEEKKPTDEDIMNEAIRIKKNVNFPFGFDQVSFQYGAQAMRDNEIPIKS